MSAGLSVVLRQRGGVIYKGSADSVTAYNQLGEFDVLQNHAQLVALIKDKVVLRHQGGYQREFVLKSGGIMSVANNVVKAFFDI